MLQVQRARASVKHNLHTCSPSHPCLKQLFKAPAAQGRRNGSLQRFFNAREAPAAPHFSRMVASSRNRNVNRSRIPALSQNITTVSGDPEKSRTDEVIQSAEKLLPENYRDYVPWGDEVTKSFDPAKKIFCNRSLNMKSITAIGFDMDYTLAQYKSETFESLVYTGALGNLVTKCGYPAEISKFEFDYKYMVRGLAIDKERGNILKMDRHKYVKIAFHGFTPLSREDRHSTYGNTKTREAFDEPRFALIDTLFSLPEAYLFAQMVEFKDEKPELLAHKSYSELYRDVRACVDMCHRDGTLKRAVARNPSKYIKEDPNMVPMLEMLRKSGRSVFLVTNSLWDYTNVVMNFLCAGRVGKDTNHDWLKHFDVVVCGSGKPRFFTEEAKMMFEVDLSTGLLANTDNGTPLVAVDSDLPQDPIPSYATDPHSSGELDVELDAARGSAGASTSGEPPLARVFQGGSYQHLHKMLGVESGTEVLYAGDHIYGDVLRAKKELGWRTMLIVPELEHELQHHDLASLQHFKWLRHRREELEDHIQRLQWCVDQGEEELGEEQVEQCQLGCDLLQLEVEEVMALHRESIREYHHQFHNVWGQLMMTGYQSSRFGHQVHRFACLYTSDVSNLMHHSPHKNYRSHQDEMPHFEL